MKMGQAQAQQQAQAQAQQQAAVEQAKQQGAAEAMAAAPVAAAASTKDVTAELQKLADMHKSGVLTDEEFAAAKKKLLG
jgi:cytosine/adenosine deaminase-related metal-dependent hydrolase